MTRTRQRENAEFSASFLRCSLRPAPPLAGYCRESGTTVGPGTQAGRGGRSSPLPFADFDEAGRYRRKLYRPLAGESPLCMFVMLNPSSAGATDNDPTVTRCIGYAKRWGYSGLYVGNLFDLVSTDPIALINGGVVLTPENDTALVDMATETVASGGKIIAAWGVQGRLFCRSNDVRRLLRPIGDLYCLRKTKDGSPSHPLYLPANLLPVPYSPHVSLTP